MGKQMNNKLLFFLFYVIKQNLNWFVKQVIYKRYLFCAFAKRRETFNKFIQRLYTLTGLNFYKLHNTIKFQQNNTN